MVNTALAHGFKIHLRGAVPIWWASNGIIKRWGPKEGSEINGDMMSLKRMLGLAPHPFAFQEPGDKGFAFICTPYSVLFLHTGNTYGTSHHRTKIPGGETQTQPSFVLSCSLVFCHLAESWLILLETVSVLDTRASICTHLPLDSRICVVLALQQTLILERHALKLLSEGSDYKLPFVKSEKHTREALNVRPLFSKKSSVFWSLRADGKLVILANILQLWSFQQQGEFYIFFPVAYFVFITKDWDLAFDKFSFAEIK